jgi:hypothetical protein
MDKRYKILSILECQSADEYWMELDFDKYTLEEIEARIGGFVIQTLLKIKQAGVKNPCMHLNTSVVSEEVFLEMKSPKAEITAELEELMRDVESGRSTGNDS